MGECACACCCVMTRRETLREFQTECAHITFDTQPVADLDLLRKLEHGDVDDAVPDGVAEELV